MGDQKEDETNHDPTSTKAAIYYCGRVVVKAASHGGFKQNHKYWKVVNNKACHSL